MIHSRHYRTSHFLLLLVIGCLLGLAVASLVHAEDFVITEVLPDGKPTVVPDAVDFAVDNQAIDSLIQSAAVWKAEDVHCDFYTAAWCGPCKPVKEMLERDYAGRYNEVDGDKRPELLQPNRVTAYPTLIFFRDGKEIQRLVGVPTPEQLGRVFTRRSFQAVQVGSLKLKKLTNEWLKLLEPRNHAVELTAGPLSVKFPAQIQFVLSCSPGEVQVKFPGEKPMLRVSVAGVIKIGESLSSITVNKEQFSFGMTNFPDLYFRLE